MSTYIIPDKNPREGKLKLSFLNYYLSKKTCLSEEWTQWTEWRFQGRVCLLLKAVEEKNCHLAFTWPERLKLNSKADQTLFA